MTRLRAFARLLAAELVEVMADDHATRRGVGYYIHGQPDDGRVDPSDVGIDGTGDLAACVGTALRRLLSGQAVATIWEPPASVSHETGGLEHVSGPVGRVLADLERKVGQ